MNSDNPWALVVGLILLGLLSGGWDTIMLVRTWINSIW